MGVECNILNISPCATNSSCISDDMSFDSLFLEMNL
jgi:hypothetical protein